MHKLWICKQAAWIVDDSDVDDSDSDGDGDADDGMVLDERDARIPGQDGREQLDFDDDQASVSLNDRESDEETEADSVMMVSLW